MLTKLKNKKRPRPKVDFNQSKMDDHQKRQKFIREFMEVSLQRNKNHVLVVCEGVVIPDSATTNEVETGIDDITLTTHIRQDSSPALIKGDMVILYRKQDDQ